MVLTMKFIGSKWYKVLAQFQTDKPPSHIYYSPILYCTYNIPLYSNEHMTVN